jgi:hypothetical protein
LVAGDLQGLAKAKAEPALVFTIPGQPSDLNDGLLQASEIAELKLNAQADMARTANDPKRTSHVDRWSCLVPGAIS